MHFDIDSLFYSDPGIDLDRVVEGIVMGHSDTVLYNLEWKKITSPVSRLSRLRPSSSLIQAFIVLAHILLSSSLYIMSGPPAGIPFIPVVPAAVPISSTSANPTISVPTPPVSSANTTQPPPSSVVTPASNAGNPSQQILAAYMLLPPSDQLALDSLLENHRNSPTSTHWSKVQRALPFDLSDNAPIFSPDGTHLPIPKLINNLADAGFHVPLTLFSYDALYKLQNQPLAVKTVKVHQNGQNVHILDVTQFPPEEEMLPLDWHSAWERYIDWIGT
ncbi:hypothetical protein F5J12DRAFT_973745 [Pisolithus orientalis]|uniref:uncharacterized protein n=1 Tax=Pisolithus orientalis TaxID=936130 RepID=UPI0022253937|nr:uncharacterized protein F5J12DRAFT_973745 [Pisolithus orientalis]KAI5986439.1 hypothetical protein F5J12DRAFT_973745 [Pisolithus orientalis]